MLDRSMFGARKTRVVVAAALVLVGASGAARADTPAAAAPEEESAAPSADGSPVPTTQRVPPGASGSARASSGPASAAAPASSGGAAAGGDGAASDGDGAGTSWFTRAPLTATAGHGARRWAMTFYGFVESDFIFDTTRSYNDAIGGALVARGDTYDGRVGRTQVSMRNTRLGLSFASPVVDGVRPTAVLEGDFFGDPTSRAPTTTESAFFASPVLRLRHAYLKLESDVVDVLVGQTYDLFGWQNFFFPCSAEFLGLPNQVFSRNGQLRLSHTFNRSGAVSVDIAAAAVRPAQRDSEIPDGNAGVRVSFNGWRGITTPGNTGTTAMPLSIGASGTARQFKANAFTPPPTQTSNVAMGWGLSLDALIPIIPATDADDRGNRLTVTGSFVFGTGIADLITSGGGATFPTLPNPAQANPPPVYSPDVDNGLVSFDTQGVLHTINWRAFRVGLHYTFPGSGRLIFAANYTKSSSDNMVKLFPRGGAEIELLGSVADTSRYADANLFWDATPAVRIGLSGQVTQVRYLDGNQPHNVRGMGQALYVF